jgi:DNA polymerase-3 subunit epsilon
MDPGASKVSGIVDDMLKDKPLFHQIADDFLDFIEDSSLVIHNAPFDMSFLNGELCLIKKSLLPFERAIDTIKIARRKFPGSPANLDALCRRFDIDLSERTTHGALIDAKLLAEVYLQLSGGRQPDLVLSSSTKERNVLHMSFEKEKTRKEPKQLILSKEEQEKHEEFLKTIKNPLWRTV